jgi:hypothetical protein
MPTCSRTTVTDASLRTASILRPRKRPESFRAGVSDMHAHPRARCDRQPDAPHSPRRDACNLPARPGRLGMHGGRVRAIPRKTGCATRQSVDPPHDAERAVQATESCRVACHDVQRLLRGALANVSPCMLQAAPALAFRARCKRGRRAVGAHAWRACRERTGRRRRRQCRGPEKNATGLLTLRKSVITFRPADVACGNE